MGAAQLAPARQVQFRIAPQALASALIQFSDQADVQVASQGVDVSHSHSQGVNGTMSVPKGLEQLLRGTGFVYVSVTDRTFAIKRPTGDIAAAAPETARPADDDPPPTPFGPTSQQISSNRKSEMAPLLSEIVVTGTRLKDSEVANGQPILYISHADILKSGITDVADLLQRLPSAGGAENRQTSLLTSSNAERIDLRYLGSNRVLVLIDGKRLADGGGGGIASGLAESADLSVIPISIIDHIEVLQDGASAVYGSDAIAGVINIITRKDFNGADLTAYGGGYADHNFDGRTQQYSLTLGHSWERGNLTGNLSWEKDGLVSMGNRDITRSIPGTGTLFYTQGLSNLYDVSNFAFGTQNDYSLNSIAGYANPTLADLHPTTDADRNHDQQFLPLLPEQTRISAYLQGVLNLTDHVQLNSTLIYSKRKSPLAEGDALVSIQSGGFSTPRYGTPDIVLAADNPFNPFGADVNAISDLSTLLTVPGKILEDYTNVIEAYNQQVQTETEQDAEFLQYMGGFSGDFSLAGRGFNWDLGFTYGREREDYDIYGTYNVDRLREELGSPSQCGPGTVNPACAPYNLFGPNAAAADQYLFLPLHNADATSERIYEANLKSDALARLPAGPLGLALGAQHLETDGRVTPDPSIIDGTSDLVQVPPSSGRYTVNSVYGELNVPLLADLPAVHRMDIDLQSRHVDYSSFGTNTSSRALFRWLPVQDLLLRGSWAQGFRAPGVNDLYGSPHQVAPLATDPCSVFDLAAQTPATQARCAAAGVGAGALDLALNSIEGGNPKLKPERSISRSAGFVYNPRWVPGLSFDADYYNISVNNAITTLSEQDILNGCYIGGNQSLCSLITRAPISGIATINDVEQNIDQFRTTGFDYGIGYRLDTRFGKLSAALQGTHIFIFDLTTPNFNSPTGVSVEHEAGIQNGVETFPFGIPKNKADLSLGWSLAPWSFNYTLFFVGSTVETCNRVNPFPTSTSIQKLGLCSDPNSTDPAKSMNYLGTTFYSDMSLTYDFGSFSRVRKSSLTVGVNNAFNRDPPVSYQNAFNFDPTLYRVPGQFLYARADIQF